MQQSTPRVTAAGLSEHVDEFVRIIGLVEEADGENLKIEASGKVNVNTKSGDPVSLGSVYEFVGKVLDDHSLRAYSYTSLDTTEYNGSLVERVVAAEKSNPELFA